MILAGAPKTSMLLGVASGPAGSQGSPLRRYRRLPFGIIVIIILQLLALLVFSGASARILLVAPEDGDLASRYYWLRLALSLLGVTVSLGLLRRQRWAWALVMIQLGAVMALDLAAYFTGEPRYVSMLISVIIVFYLNQSEVQDTFRRRRQPVDELT